MLLGALELNEFGAPGALVVQKKKKYATGVVPGFRLLFLRIGEPARGLLCLLGPFFRRIVRP